MGIVTRSGIEHMMSGQYGFSLHARRPISNIINTSPLVTDSTTAIDIVSRMAMSRPLRSIYDFIVVTEQNTYLGVVTIKDLLEKTMEIEVFSSRHLNPLSGLPWNLSGKTSSDPLRPRSLVPSYISIWITSRHTTIPMALATAIA
jgi:hypothetical protein